MILNSSQKVQSTQAEARAAQIMRPEPLRCALLKLPVTVTNKADLTVLPFLQLYDLQTALQVTHMHMHMHMYMYMQYSGLFCTQCS
jgi:hypothetical protein